MVLHHRSGYRRLDAGWRDWMCGVFAGSDQSEAGSAVMTRFLLELAIYFLSFVMFGLFLVHVLEKMREDDSDWPM